MAAVNIDGLSMCWMMDIPIEFNKETTQKINPWDESKLRYFKQRFDVTKIATLIVDEISTIKPYMLAYLNARLQEACNSDKPFGGIAVVLLGDFDQLPPAGGPSIPEVAMMVTRSEYTKGVPLHKKRRYDITTVIRQGVELFTKAKHIKLSTQHRSEDQEHTHLLEKMSDGNSIGINDLKNYKTLSPSDREFEFATILTPGNRERHEFNRIQAKRWAERHGTNVVRWPRKLNEKTWKGRPRNPQNELRAKEESSSGRCSYHLLLHISLTM